MTIARIKNNGDLQITDEIIEYPSELVGGRNLLRNSNLSLGTEFWSGGGPLVDGGLLLEGTEGNGYLVYNTTIIPEGEYTLQVWYEVLEGQAPYLYDNKNSDLQTSNNYPFEVDKDYFEVGVTIGASNSMFAFRYAAGSPADHRVGKTLIKRVKLEKSTEATDWTPAPEDLGMKYPDDIQHFTTRFRTDGKMMVREFIEGEDFGFSFDKKMYLNELEEGVDLDG